MLRFVFCGKTPAFYYIHLGIIPFQRLIKPDISPHKFEVFRFSPFPSAQGKQDAPLKKSRKDWDFVCYVS